MKRNKQQLIENLRKENWHDFGNMNSTEKTMMMKSNLERAVSPMIKNVTIRTISNAKKWFDEELNTLKREEIIKHNIWKKTRENNKWREYIEVRNKYNKLKKEEKNISLKNELIRVSNNKRKRVGVPKKNTTNENK